MKIKYFFLLMSSVLFFFSCSQQPVMLLSDHIQINLEKNTSDSMALIFSSNLSDKHKTKPLIYTGTTDFTPRKTKINDTFKGILNTYLSKKFTNYTVYDSTYTGYSIHLSLKDFEIPKAESSKTGKVHLITDYVMDGILSFSITLKNNGDIVAEKDFIAESSLSYSVDSEVKAVLESRKELISKTCNVGVAKIQSFLKENNL